MPSRPARGGPPHTLSHSDSQSQIHPQANRGRGGGRGRGGRGGPSRSGHESQPTGSQQSLLIDPVALPVTTTVGVRRPGHGTAGRRVQVLLNAGEIDIPKTNIYHYDVTITGPSDKSYPPRFTQQLIKQLQNDTAPRVFQPAGVYDGKKNLYMPHLLDFGGSDSATFTVSVSPESSTPRPPSLFTVKLVKVASINPEVLDRFIHAQQSHDEGVLTTLMAMNVAVRQSPIIQGFAFNTRSFFPTTAGTMSKPVMGIQFARGIFQSVRPTLEKVILNVDVTTAMVYQTGSLIGLCLGYLGSGGREENNPLRLSPTHGLPDRERIRLQRFISGIRVQVITPSKSQKIITIVKLSNIGASNITFTQRDGKSVTVAEYFKRAHGRVLRYPEVICAQTSSNAAIPLELLTVLPSQIARKQVPPEVTSGMVEFSQLKPAERMGEIKKGLELLAHGQSEYVRNFGMGMTKPTGGFPMTIEARVLNPPRLHYGGKKGLVGVDPRNGSWNLMDKTLIEPRSVNRWCIVIFEAQGRFKLEQAHDMARTIVGAFGDVGMQVLEPDPIIHYANPQADISKVLKEAGGLSVKKHGNGKGPDLLVVVLPDSGNAEIYRAVKHFGDIEMGVATQCLKASKCKRAKIQYWANVALKVNPKLGGINHKPDPSSRTATDLNDPNRPTIVLGADVMHPSPGSHAPSYTAVVGNVDSDVAKYISEGRVQTGRNEIIEELGEMVKIILRKYMDYRKNVERKPNSQPKRLIFFRDGVSEGQYQQVKLQELQVIREVCRSLNIQPKITFIIVAKRHHFRFFPPSNSKEADKSGNCPSGTVVDTGITHPTEFDFYLQSHGGLLGTSRSAHYHVLEDESGFTADAVQNLCFGLCHVFARSTRTISIPAPVAYADIVCSRAPNHYKYFSAMSDVESTTTGGSNSNTTALEKMKAEYKPVHKNHGTRMFFT